MLGAGLLVLLFLALVVLIPCLRERRIALQVQSVGGTVSYEYFGPAWLSQSLRDQAPLFDRITMIRLYRTKNTDRALPDLWRLEQLEALELESSDVSDEGLKALERMTHLRGLGLNHTRISDAGLVHLKRLTALQGLHLDGTETTDAGLKHLQGLPHLQLLNLSNTRVSDASAEFLSSFRELQLLNLAGSRMTHRGYVRLRRALPNCELPLIFDMQMLDNRAE